MGHLRVEIIDRDSARTVPARCYLTDSTDKSWSPPGAISYVKPPEQNFIAMGEIEIDLPPGAYRLVVERGPEYHSATRQIEIRSGQTRQEKIELMRWISMNARGWYSGDLHNHRNWKQMPELLLANDLNLAPTLTEWIGGQYFSTSQPNSTAPSLSAATEAVRVVDASHVYSVADTEIERLREGPGAIDLVALSFPLKFRGFLVSPPNSVFTEMAHRQGGYADAEKITWRDTAALVALGQVDFAGIVHNHFNRHGVMTETDRWGMIPKEKPEYSTPTGMPLWAMDVYYKFLNCGFRLPVSAGSASGVMPSPVGFNRAYVYLPGKFGYAEWFRALKAGRSFATNGPMLFLSVEGHKPGETIVLPPGGSAATQGTPLPPANRLRIRVEASSAGELERLEVVWKGHVIKTVRASDKATSLSAELEVNAHETGWIVARAFEKSAEAIRFAHTSPVYVQVGNDRGLAPEDAKFFLAWIDREATYYENLSGFPTKAAREQILALFRLARAVYEQLAGL